MNWESIGNHAIAYTVKYIKVLNQAGFSQP